MDTIRGHVKRIASKVGLIDGKIDGLVPTINNVKASIDQKLGAEDNAETDPTIFGKLAEIKKISAERRTQIATTLGRMDVVGLSDSSTAKELADGLDSIPVNPKETAVLTTNGQVRAIPRGYHRQGGQVRTNIANLTPSNIKDGVNVGGVVGSFSGEVAVRTYAQIHVGGTKTLSFGTKIISIHSVGSRHQGTNPVIKTPFTSMVLNQMYYIDDLTGALSSEDKGQVVSIKRLNENSFDIRSRSSPPGPGIAIHYV